ncbi:hypothetical protein CONPUDRAFT_133377 [Coniophora puteana RWD-64-598 SS2]|uniref:Uncharacterized protein n=1 Tax=Coniophora puteana (strain RWD-64-598) TaxID=741705 RepID=R7SGD8_CONPW|nr:uncharacterized protein CONPUDRAFT_133377 [Coniophora puteana RWD-64-598 SS2]EIW74149.1 hypothetical protein CONPUDRAFT_133377 [Coniophora puteana RWD-64-598 SS2]
MAGKRPVYSIPVIVFLDDVSGNQSKQWNEHFSCYMSTGALPREKLSEEFHVRFIATSPHATPLEMMQGIRTSMEKTFQNPVEAYDCETKEEVLLQVYPLLFAGDNPMQSELCSCAGLNANHFCRTCMCGGTQEYKRSDEGFKSFFMLAEASRSTGIKDHLAQPILDSIVKIGQDLRKATPDRAAVTPDVSLTETGVDIHKDTPTEILHTILLGVVKYFWAQTTTLLEKDKKLGVFQSRLHSVEESGLNIPKLSAEYMCQYKGGLIGKHFKCLSQVMAFAVHGLVPQDVLDAWIVTGRMVVLLWHTEIENIDDYSRDLNQIISNFLHITAKCSPSIIISKPKFHFLIHLVFYIRRFGPALLFSTERYESYNAVFRAASIHSNHQAPNRDIV